MKMDNDSYLCSMCPRASHSSLALFSGSEEKSAIGSLPDDGTSSFSVVLLDLTGEGTGEDYTRRAQFC